MNFRRVFPTLLTFTMAASATLLTPALAQQAPTVDVSGTWSGTISGTDFCVDLTSGSQTQTPFSTDVTLSLTASGLEFTGTGTAAQADGTQSEFTLVGGADPGGFFGASIEGANVTEGVQFSGGLSGSVDGDTMQITVEVSDVQTPDQVEICTTVAEGTLTRGATEGVVNPEDTASSVITAPTILKTQVQAISTSLTARINDVVRGVGGGPRVTANGVYQGVSGLAAGEDGPAYGVWASYSYSDFDNDFAATALDGHRHNVLFGADMTPRDNMVLGFAVGYESSSIDTDFNDGDQDTDGYTVAPYFGLILSDNWNISASVGYSNLDTDQYRTDPLLGTRIDSSADSDRWFGTLNLNGYKQWNDWLFTGRIGMLQARSNQDGFTESDGTVVGKFRTELGQWNVGGEAAYSWGEFEPFLRASYEHDYSLTRIAIAGTGPQPSNDNDNWLFGLGLRYFSTENGLSGNIEWYKRLGREDYDEDTFSATIRWDF